MRALILILLMPLAAWAGNALEGHPSPYLALHGDDPVEWRDWGAAAVREARESNRPLFVSSGYFSCHWCHVMQRESYQNAEIATLLNRHFIPVKVDRELHPALDEHLIRFVERTRGQAGWPLNVFLTPDGYPMVGLTYLPPGEFLEVLARVAAQWEGRSEALASLAREASAELAAERESRGAQPLRSPDELAAALAREALALGDELGGGFGNQSRFPMEPQLLALLELYRRYGDKTGLGPLLRLTLDEMARRGLRDHLAGGFFRYTVDPDWRTPHYEKMLYNQALLARVYLEASTVLDEPRYLEVAAETLDFVLDQMAGSGGGFISSLSALDAAGEEGGSYLWNDEALARALTPGEVALARAWWSLEPGPSPATGWLPQRLRSPAEAAAATGLDEAELRQRLPAVRDKLLGERRTRMPPRDDKQLAAWNGLLLLAFTDMAAARDEPRYREAAAGIAGFLRTLWDGERLFRARQGIRVLGEAGLEDYAYVAGGLDAWARFADDPGACELARTIVAAGWRYFFDPTGWRIEYGSVLPDMPRDPALQDGALPSPSAALIAASSGLAPAVTGEQVALGLALSVRQATEAPFWYAGHAVLLLGDAASD